MMQRLLLLTFFMLFCSTVGSSQDFWEEIGNLNKGPVSSLAVDNEGRIFALTDSGLYRSTNNGGEWSRLNAATRGLYYERSVAVAPSGDILAPDSAGMGIWQSTDGGESWSHRALDIQSPTDIEFHPSGFIFCKTYDGVYRSTDGGVNWDSVASLSGRVMAIDSSGNIYVLDAGDISVGPDGLTMIPDSCHRSTDLGDSWAGMGGPVGASEPTVQTAVAFLITSTGTMIVASDEMGWFSSTDEGRTWTRHPGHQHWPAFAMNSEDRIFFGTELQGVRTSVDDGLTWSTVNSGLADSSICSLAIDNSGYAYAGTTGGKIFRSVNQTTNVHEEVSAVPTGFALGQNYPNPFNPSTTIRFNLPERTHVTLKVFNLVGQEVATLVDERLDAGSKAVEFSGEGLPSGVYFYQLRAGAFSETRKLLLLR